MAEQIQEKNDWNFGKMIKGDERLNTYVFEAADFLAPFFGLDIMKILPDIPVADFFDKYRAIFGGSLVGWQLDASFFYIPPPQRIPLDPEPGEKLDDFVIEGGKYFKLVPDKERFFFFRRNIQRGQKTIGHEVSHWLHELLNPDLFKKESSLPKFPTYPKNPEVSSSALVTECVGHLGGILYQTRNPKSIEEFNFRLPQLLEFDQEATIKNKTQLFYFYYQNFAKNG